jgi:quercetin dioxygenase-like cupin family protein
MKLNLIAITAVLMHCGAYAEHHEADEPAIAGMVFSETFDLAGEVDLYVERYKSCGDTVNPKHYHPMGTLVYVLDGKAVSDASGEWQEYGADSYWFEPSDWVHGGADNSGPLLGDEQCRETLVIRAARKGESATVFVE